MGLLQKAAGLGMDITHYTVESKKIPASFSDFKILHLSDFHCEPKKGIITLVKQEKPDAIFMTGDMVDDRYPCGSFFKLLKSLLNAAPVYIVSGNHDSNRYDYHHILDICRNMGAVYLQNQTVKIRKREDEIILHGIDDPAARPSDKLDSKITEYLSKLERKEGYEILLFHRANKLDLLKNENFDLILSGHMHGGQIRLPRLGGIVAPKSSFGDSGRMFFPKYSGGRYIVGGSDVIVNRGMGNSLPLPRFGNPTEIVSIILKQKK